MRVMDHVFKGIATVAGSRPMLWTVSATGKILGRLRRLSKPATKKSTQDDKSNSS